jgi:hypothetical protein
LSSNEKVVGIYATSDITMMASKSSGWKWPTRDLQRDMSGKELLAGFWRADQTVSIAAENTSP